MVKKQTKKSGRIESAHTIIVIDQSDKEETLVHLKVQDADPEKMPKPTKTDGNAAKPVKIEVKHWLDEESVTPASTNVGPQEEIETADPVENVEESEEQWHLIDGSTDDALSENSEEPEDTSLKDEVKSDGDDSSNQLQSPDDATVAMLDEIAHDPDFAPNDVAEEADKTPIDSESEEDLQQPEEISSSNEVLPEEVGPQEPLDKPQADEKQAKKSRPPRMKRWRLVAALATTFLVLIAAVPTTRFMALNLIGIRAAASLTIIDSESKQPLRGVLVEMNGQSKKTDQNGGVSFSEVALGSHKLSAMKIAYDEVSTTKNISFGDNQLGQVELVPNGDRYNFVIQDWLSGQPLAGAKVAAGDAEAYSGADGSVSLLVPKSTAQDTMVDISSDGYTVESLTISQASTGTPVKLVLERSHFFISQDETGFALSRVTGDGSSQVEVLRLNEDDKDLRYETSPNGKKGVLVARMGSELSELSLVDLSSGTVKKIDESEKFDLLGWVGERIVYTKVQAGSAADDPQRHRLVGLDTTNESISELAASSYFNDILVTDEYVLYAPGSSEESASSQGLYRIRADGSDKRTMFERSVWTILRSGIDEIIFDSNQVWYQGTINNIANKELSSRPEQTRSRLYSQSTGGTRMAYLSERDDRMAIVVRDTATGQEKDLWIQGDIRYPLVWLSENHLTFRVASTVETADYIVHIGAGDPVKLADTSRVSGVDRWYYYYE
jgi:hypothetical protein